MIYAGFRRRLAALLVDMVVVVAFVLPYQYFSRQFGREVFLILTFLTGLIVLVYTMYFNARYGATIGKMVAGVKLVKLDGSPIGYREAFYRNSVDLIITVIISILHLYTLKDVTAAQLPNLDIHRLVQYYNTGMPVYGNIFEYITQFWTLSELIVLLFNKKKRAIHDFIAGTVVIVRPPAVGRNDTASAVPASN